MDNEDFHDDHTAVAALSYRASLPTPPVDGGEDTSHSSASPTEPIARANTDTTEVLVADLREEQDTPTVRAAVLPTRETEGEESVCGVCLEPPAANNSVETLCCGNVLCVKDAESIGKCPFCRQAPLIWDITH